MHAADINLKQLLQFDPATGIVTLGGERMVLFSTESIGRLTAELIDIGEVASARVVLRRFGETGGRQLAQMVKREFQPDDDMEWLAMGPAIHAWEGFARPELQKLEYQPERGHFFLSVKMTNSFLADEFVRVVGRAEEPVCWLLAGNISGYCTTLFGKSIGQDILCKETKCVAKGDPHCEFIVKPKSEWI